MSFSAFLKCKWANEMPSLVQSTPPNKRVTFEKQYHNDGGYRLYGLRIVMRNLCPLLTLTGITSSRLRMLWCIFHLTINLLSMVRMKLCNQ
jgi:hypothetical protein